MSIKYIFCISTGRSGTAYLCKLFSGLNACSAYHEQKPILHNHIMRDYLNGNELSMKPHILTKINKIRNCESDIYVDTSHIFIKSFGWEIPKHIPEQEIGVVVLKRNKEKVVESTQRVHSGPFTYLGKKWILTPYKNAVIKPPINYYVFQFYRYLIKLYWLFKGESQSITKTYPKFFRNKSLTLINWYYDEIYALGNKFKKTFPKITYVDVNLEDLNTHEGFENIIHAFKLEAYYNKESVKDVIGKATNLKTEF